MRTRHALHPAPAETQHWREVSANDPSRHAAAHDGSLQHLVTERGRAAGGGARVAADMGGSPSLIMWPEPARYWAICAQLKTEAWQAGSFVRFAAYLSRQQTAAPGRRGGRGESEAAGSVQAGDPDVVPGCTGREAQQAPAFLGDGFAAAGVDGRRSSTVAVAALAGRLSCHVPAAKPSTSTVQ
jgi:hypothetical protein